MTGVQTCALPIYHPITQFMKLYVEPMDATIVEIDRDGRVRFEAEGWSTPTLQEQRAIIYAAQNELAELTELLETLQKLQNGKTL